MNHSEFTPYSLLLIPYSLILATLLLLLQLTGCSNKESQDNDAIRFGISTEPVTLDPRYATDAVSVRINRLIYQRLVEFDEHYRFIPSLATWERLSPTHYRFFLKDERPDFHDGRPLTAGDVKATYNSVLEPANASPHRSALEVIKRIKVIDGNSLDFHLRRPDSLFPGRLTIGVLPAALVRQNHGFNQQPVGNGPFSFIRRTDGGNLALERNRDGQIIHFQVVRDPTVRVLKLLNGEIDLIQNELPMELVEWLEEKDAVRIRTIRGDTLAYIGFNLQDPALGDRRVRQAIGHAIDREPVIRHLLRNAARPADALLPPEHWAGRDSPGQDEYSPQRAGALLEEAGYNRQRPLELTFKTSTNPRSLRIATIFQQQLARVGISVSLSSYDWGTFYGDIRSGKFQMYSLSWVGLKMPDIYRYIFHSDSVPPEGANRGRYSDRQVDRLIEKAENAGGLQDKAVFYHRIQERLHETRPYVPLWYEDNILVIRRGLAGYRPAVDGNYDDLANIRRTNRGYE